MVETTDDQPSRGDLYRQRVAGCDRVGRQSSGEINSGKAAVGTTQVPPALWKHWRYSAAIAVPAARSPRLVRALVSDQVSRRAMEDWSDLRVIDDSGREVPFVLHARLGRRSSEDRSARLMDVTYKPGDDTRATLDLGAGAPVHNGIEIQTAAP